MFKKIFHASTAELPTATSSPGLYSELTLSESSHTVPSAERTQSEKRFFLRRPLKLRPDVEENTSYFRSFDPFSIKLNLKRSKSFPFKAKPEQSDDVLLGIPKSKSVHFAENLATYHEFKAGSIGLNFGDCEATFEEFLQLKQDEESDDGSDESELDGQEVDIDSSALVEVPEAERADEVVSRTTSDGTIVSQKGPRRKASRRKGSSGTSMKLAGQHLQSIFSDLVTTENSTELIQPVSFDNSDSTDVDLDENEAAPRPESREEKGQHEAQDIGHDWFLYHVYEQLSDLVQHKTRQFRECDSQQLKTDILCGIADLGDSVGDFRDQLTQTKKEIFLLRRTLQEVSQDKDKEAAAASGYAKQSAKLEEVVKQQAGDIKALQDVIQLHERGSQEATESQGLVETLEKLKVDLTHQLQISKGEIVSLKEKLFLLEVVHKENVLGLKQREELVVQLDSAKKQAKALQEFQETERELVQEEATKLNADLENAKVDINKKALYIQQLELSVQTQREANEQRLNEASLMINELGKHYEEKKAQMAMIMDIADSLVRQFSRHDRAPPVSLSEPPKRKTSVQEQRQRSTNPDFDRIIGLLGNLKDIHGELQARETPRLRESEQRSCSNRLAMESLKALIKGSFDTLLSIFHKQTAVQFMSAYGELSKVPLLNDQNRHLVLVLCNYILNAQRDLLHQHQQNESMLEKEMHDRLKYQQQVLDSFTRIVRQVIDNNRNSRMSMSGIRGHSSPLKKRPGKGL